MKKVFLQLCTILMLVGLMMSLAVTVSASEPVSGKWGDLLWTLDRNTGLLTISGNGAMDDFEFDSTEAWRTYRDHIKKIKLDEGVTSIGNEAFNSCSNLKSVILPSSLKRIGDAAFRNCFSLSNLEIPMSVEKIGSSAFTKCEKLIQTENELSYVGRWLIDYDPSIAHTVALRDDTIGIADSAFVNCWMMTKVSIPSDLAFIGDLAFARCIGLTNIKIPKSVRSIGIFAFTRCDNLASIDIAVGLKDIGEYAFYECSNLEVIRYEGCRESWETIHIGRENPTCFDSPQLKNNHPFGDWELHDQNQHKRTCVCTEVEYSDHAYGEWAIVREATEDAQGLREKVCICGHKIEENIPMIEKDTSVPEKNIFGCASVTRSTVMIALTVISAACFVVKKKKFEA